MSVLRMSGEEIRDIFDRIGLNSSVVDEDQYDVFETSNGFELHQVVENGQCPEVVEITENHIEMIAECPGGADILPPEDAGYGGSSYPVSGYIQNDYRYAAVISGLKDEFADAESRRQTAQADEQ